MISRRNFFGITMMMGALMFLFLFMEVIKDSWNDYEINAYMTARIAGNSATAWRPVSNLVPGKTAQLVVLIGEEDSAISNTVSQWCTYSKRRLLIYGSLEEYNQAKVLAGLLLLDSGNFDPDGDMESLNTLIQKDVPIVFCNLPDIWVILENEELCSLLGIRTAVAKEVELSGIHLFSGFLLGGEAIYERDSDEPEREDLDFTVPWYQLDSGTKTYMMGMVESVEGHFYKEDMPALIWRNTSNGTPVFAICGDYMEDAVGLGILSAIATEIDPFELYPVVNAQNLVVKDYPGLSAENEATLKRLYSRGQEQVVRDVIWPGLAMVAEQSGSKLTCLVMPQYLYNDGIEPLTDNLIYYQRLFKEQGVEMGVSLYHSPDITLEEKVQGDRAFLFGEFQYGSCYMTKDEVADFIQQNAVYLLNIRSIITDYDPEGALLSYFTTEILLQKATIDAYSHTYREDLRMRAIETALGYSNIILDMNRVLWPVDESVDRWELLSDEFSRNVMTYWRSFEAFDDTVLLESDERVRKFFNLDYSYERREGTIRLLISNFNEEAWFILRLHGEELIEVAGGTAVKLEDGAYLISAEQSTVWLFVAENTWSILQQ